MEASSGNHAATNRRRNSARRSCGVSPNPVIGSNGRSGSRLDTDDPPLPETGPDDTEADEHPDNTNTTTVSTTSGDHHET